MTYAFHTPDKLCFVLDLMNGGDLHYHLSQHGVFNEQEMRFYAAEVILGNYHSPSIGSASVPPPCAPIQRLSTTLDGFSLKPREATARCRSPSDGRVIRVRWTLPRPEARVPPILAATKTRASSSSSLSTGSSPRAPGPRGVINERQGVGGTRARRRQREFQIARLPASHDVRLPW